MTIDRNLIQRTLAGIVFLAVMIFCICWNNITVSVLFGVLSVLAVYELVQLVSTKTGAHRNKYVSLALVVLLILGLFLQFHHVFNFIQSVWVMFIPFLAASVLFLLPNQTENRLVQPVVFIFSVFYIVVPFVLLRSLAANPLQDYFPVLFLFALVWTNDTMAYVCGRLLGKHLLAPNISPKKTWEGFVGGIVFSVVASLVIHLSLGLKVNAPEVWILPLIVSVFATIGDLFESAIKRWAGVKDSGNLIPGHGGILDRFDGAMFAAVPYFFMLQTLQV